AGDHLDLPPFPTRRSSDLLRLHLCMGRLGRGAEPLTGTDKGLEGAAWLRPFSLENGIDPAKPDPLRPEMPLSPLRPGPAVPGLSQARAGLLRLQSRLRLCR